MPQDEYEAYLEELQKQTQKGETGTNLKQLVRQLLYETKLRKQHEYERIAREGGFGTSPEELGAGYTNVNVNARIQQALDARRNRQEVAELESGLMSDAATADAERYKLNEVIAQQLGYRRGGIVETPPTMGVEGPVRSFTNLGAGGAPIVATRNLPTGPISPQVQAQLPTTLDMDAEHQATVEQLANTPGSAELLASIRAAALQAQARMKPDEENFTWDQLSADRKTKVLNLILTTYQKDDDAAIGMIANFASRFAGARDFYDRLIK
jgi:hypothetical protein